MKFEILLSTMYRTNLFFLGDIFINNTLEDFNILIINQTEEGKILHSNNPKIRVINSFERGTSASRNLGIINSKGNICLFSDDDVVFKSNFKDHIVEAYQKYPNAHLINFETVSIDGIPHVKYPSEGLLNKKTIRSVHMTGITICREKFISLNVLFNPYFSLGGKFSGGTEYVFLREALYKGLIAYHRSEAIVIHDEKSSGKEISSDRVIHTNSARYNHFHGNLMSKLLLLKYIFFLLRKKLINFNQVRNKIYIGLKGIKEYNQLIKKGLISRQK